MADIQPDRLTTCQLEQKSVVSRRPSVLDLCGHTLQLLRQHRNQFRTKKKKTTADTDVS
jgi:hypothetical protein